LGADKQWRPADTHGLTKQSGLSTLHVFGTAEARKQQQQQQHQDRNRNPKTRISHIPLSTKPLSVITHQKKPNGPTYRRVTADAASCVRSDGSPNFASIPAVKPILRPSRNSPAWHSIRPPARYFFFHFFFFFRLSFTLRLHLASLPPEITQRYATTIGTATAGPRSLTHSTPFPFLVSPGLAGLLEFDQIDGWFSFGCGVLFLFDTVPYSDTHTFVFSFFLSFWVWCALAGIPY
jgi:hypothetical protein